MDAKRRKEILESSNEFAHDVAKAFEMAKKTPNQYLVENYSERFEKILEEDSYVWDLWESLRIAIFDLLKELGFSHELADSVSSYIGPDR